MVKLKMSQASLKLKIKQNLQVFCAILLLDGIFSCSTFMFFITDEIFRRNARFSDVGVLGDEFVHGGFAEGYRATASYIFYHLVFSQ